MDLETLPEYVIRPDLWCNIEDSTVLREHLEDEHDKEVGDGLLHRHLVPIHQMAHVHAEFRAPFAHYHLRKEH